MHDKRFTPRYKTSIKVMSGNPEAPEIAHITNISTGGIFIETRNVLPIDTEFSMRFRLPDDTETLAVKCRVSWLKQVSASSAINGMGVEFIKMSYEHLRKIQAYIDGLAGQDHGQCAADSAV